MKAIPKSSRKVDHQDRISKHFIKALEDTRTSKRMFKERIETKGVRPILTP